MASESVLENHRSTTRASLNFRGWTWKTCAGAIGICGGIVSPVFGSILTAVSWFTGPVWHRVPVHHIGAILLFLTIPLLLGGAHCLDLVDKENDKAKRHNFKV